MKNPTSTTYLLVGCLIVSHTTTGFSTSSSKPNRIRQPPPPPAYFPSRASHTVGRSRRTYRTDKKYNNNDPWILFTQHEDGGGEEASPSDDSPSSSKASFSVASIASTTATSSSNPGLQKTTMENRWKNFDYEKHWYPTMWERDLPVNKPTKVTLFDVDYVLAKDSTGQLVTALQDKCPHKSAALSEGRITSGGLIQCAYHGWSFNGTTGACAQIPQAGPDVSKFPARTCAKAIPARIWQGLVWLWPGPAPADNKYPDPPSVPEMDLPNWKQLHIVRDFPVDFSLLLSNIMDPDHGMYAHTALAFDYYSASAKYPMQLEESFEDGGWSFCSRVEAVDKLLAVDREKRKALGQKVKPEKTPKSETLMATTLFQAPTTVALSRRNETTNETTFITAFWVCPIGVGKSRFLSVALSNSLPFQVPRWLFQINVNGFLDQDTLLVASQQPAVLSAEAEGEHARQSLYAYSSASDRVVRLIDQFWDSTLSKVPNRKRVLQQLHQSGQLQETPPREVVLDRQSQHLKICPDSQKFVANCKRIRNIALGVAATWLVRTLFQRCIKSRWVLALSVLTAWASEQLRKQFYYVKTEASRDSDLAKIPIKAWLDP